MRSEDAYLSNLIEIAEKLGVDQCHSIMIEEIEILQAIRDKYNKMIESIKSNEITIKIKIDTTELDKVEERINKIKNIKIENTIVTNNVNRDEVESCVYDVIQGIRNRIEKNGIKR